MTNKSKKIELEDIDFNEIEDDIEIIIEGDLKLNKDEILQKVEKGLSKIIKENSALPEQLFLLPVRDRPFFPGQTLPIVLSKDLWGKTIRKALDNKQDYIGIIFVKANDDEKITSKHFSKTGTIVKIHQPKFKKDYIQLIAEGISRFEIQDWILEKSPFQAKVIYPEDINNGSATQIKAYALAIMNAFKELLPFNPLYSEELKFFLNRYSATDAQHLSDFAASLTTADNSKLQDVLDTINIIKRLEKVQKLFKQELEVTKLQHSIRERAEDNINNQQHDYFLRQQLKEIQRDLGLLKDDRTIDIDKFKKLLKKLTLTDDTNTKVTEELDKIFTLDSQSPEYAIAKNWLDWVTKLPWQKYSKDKLSLSRAKKILDKGHNGLEDVKNRILEFLAVGALKGGISGSIICLVGPPGVGKTSIGKSIADTMGRKFYRFSVGGMRDEAEMKGHRRTYVGAMPGKFIQALKDCQTANPVIMLDEIDKMGSSYQGDPGAALLEVLDPEQNHDFMDNYLDIRFDLSKVVFICTANSLDTIPSALLDRMEVIRLSGYITEEKIKIAKRHLIPKLLNNAGFTKQQVKFTPATLKYLIEGYAREAGVRNLNKQLAKVIRKLALKFITEDIKQTTVNIKSLTSMLGQPYFSPEKINQQLGTVTGLAWTSMGGATLTIEASRVHTHSRGFKLSGQLGDVMKESAEIAYSYISANLEHLQADAKFYDKAFVHIHVPDGATPKDGPSAGITMATSLLSLARNEPIKQPLAMTGELSLTGQVLPVGGIKEKVIAAKRIGIKTLILPNDNRKNFEELADYLQEGMTIHFAKHFDDVAKLSFCMNKIS